MHCYEKYIPYGKTSANLPDIMSTGVLSRYVIYYFQPSEILDVFFVISDLWTSVQKDEYNMFKCLVSNKQNPYHIMPQCSSSSS